MKLACPNCGGNVIYVLGSDYVFCEYCNEKIKTSKINIDEFLEFAKEMKEKKQELDNKDTAYLEQLTANNNDVDIVSANYGLYYCNICNKESQALI